MDYTKFRLRSFTALQSKYILRCGSYYELPLKYCFANPTDRDSIQYYYDICAIPWNRNPPKNTKCTILRIDGKQTPPGFAKLKVDRDNTKDNAAYFRRPLDLRDIITGGPSVPSEQRLTHVGRASNKLNHFTIAFDEVFAVYCPYWPLEAEEWRKRKRLNGWPNEKLIARITRGGCHFVSKLRTWSSCDDTEWRFSFSKAELLLIHSWTPDQKFAYHALRVIKRRLSEFCGGDRNKGFQTYYFKTLMFWACEEHPQEVWSEQNLNNCVQKLLLRFYKCLDEKFCPSYFIPECNIMSHLEDKGSFEKELQTLQMFLTNKTVITVDICPSLSAVVLDRSFECYCLDATSSSCPLNEELNERCAQYFSECECFLPEMRNLHAAIEAQLRLMSVDSVTQRQASKDYVNCLENFDLALLKREEFEPWKFVNTGMSESDNMMRIFVRKLLRNPVEVYRRNNYKGHDFVKTITESYPSNLYCATSVYRANFYFSAKRSYNECLSECETCFENLNNKSAIGVVYRSIPELTSHIPILICNSFSQIFDEHLQVILGFATLHMNSSSSSSPVIATCHEVCLKLDAWEFLKYICIQCQRRLNSVEELTDYTCSTNFFFDRPDVSQLINYYSFSATILFAALRQSKAYKNPLRGSLIPDYFSQRK